LIRFECPATEEKFMGNRPSSNESSSNPGIAATRLTPGDIFSVPEDLRYLEGVQLEALSSAFRAWLDRSSNVAKRQSRGRVWLIYQVLRFTGARLGEVLGVCPPRDFDFENNLVRFGEKGAATAREAQLPPETMGDIRTFLADPANAPLVETAFHMDPGFIRKKFYERAEELGWPKEMANPRVLRRSRAIELLRANVPLSVVQAMLGHASAGQTAAYVDFPDEDVKRIIGHFIQREAKRKTSARNTFYGQVTSILRGDVQAEVELTTWKGDRVYSVITNDSLDSLHLCPGKMALAIVKAPWVIVSTKAVPQASVRNRFKGKVSRIVEGRVACEIVVDLQNETSICAVVTLESIRELGLQAGDAVWVLFNSFAVILDVD
jgi:molybdate transport system regulatory protein